MNISIVSESIEVTVWDDEVIDGNTIGFAFDIAQTVSEMYFSLPGVTEVQEMQHRGACLKIDYATYARIGEEKYNELISITHTKIVEMSDLYISNKSDYEVL